MQKQYTKEELFKDFEANHLELYRVLEGMISYDSFNNNMYWFYSTSHLLHSASAEQRRGLIEKEIELVNTLIKPIIKEYGYCFGVPIVAASLSSINIPIEPVNIWHDWVCATSKPAV